jgi:methyl-accepting chemotaxis protein
MGLISISSMGDIANQLNNNVPQTMANISDAARLNQDAMFIRYYDEVLTMSARNYAFTGNARWKQRYYASAPLLDEQINEAIARGDREDKAYFSSINDSNVELVRLEEQSVSFTDQGRLQDAIAILESDEYWQFKQVYQDGLISYAKKRGSNLNETLVLSTARLSSITSKASNRATVTRYVSIICLTIALAISLYFVIYITTVMSWLFYKLLNGIDQIISGNLNYRIEKSSISEFSQLAEAFNKMVEKISANDAEVKKKIELKTVELASLNQSLERKIVERTRELEQAKKDLNLKVNERTRELELKNKELEKLNRLGLDWELKMMEIKSKMKELSRKN